MTSDPTLAIDLRGVSKRFGPKPPSLDGLSLEVKAGLVFGYLGTNGAGKTTTIRILLGLLRRDAGDVRVLGLDPNVDATRIRSEVGVLLDNDGLYERLTATQNLEFHAQLRHLQKKERETRIEELLRAAALWERRNDRVATFSKGMRQKLAIARTLLHRPRLVLLDEPFTGLDPIAAAELRGTIATLAREQGTTVLLTTHDLAHVEKACDEVAVLSAGRVVACGALDALRAERAGIEVAVSGAGLDEALLEAMKRAGAIVSFALDAKRAASARVTCSAEQRPRLGSDLVQRGVVLEDLTTVRASLEDTFLALVTPAGAAS
jgi:ABC-2 type transport system ATP-binding protein